MFHSDTYSRLYDLVSFTLQKRVIHFSLNIIVPYPFLQYCPCLFSWEAPVKGLLQTTTEDEKAAHCPLALSLPNPRLTLEYLINYCDEITKYDHKIIVFFMR